METVAHIGFLWVTCSVPISPVQKRAGSSVGSQYYSKRMMLVSHFSDFYGGPTTPRINFSSALRLTESPSPLL